MYPEDLYAIEITNDFIKVTHPQENDKTVLWDNITAVSYTHLTLPTNSLV